MASTGTGGTPFFGSKISLISKSEIRYEGQLYAIDANESTIALSNVKSFGSEDRPVKQPIPPRDEEFTLIIFRASDIKDLIVDDATPQSNASALDDPAVVQAHASSTTSFPSSFPQPSSINQVQQLRGSKNEQAPNPQASAAESKPKTAASVLQGLNKQPQPKQPQPQSQPQAQQTLHSQSGVGVGVGVGVGGGNRHISNKPQQPQQSQSTTQQQGGQRLIQRSNQRRNQNNQGGLNRDYQPRTGGGFRNYNMVSGGNRNMLQHNANFNNRGPRNVLRGSGTPFRGGSGGGIKFANNPLPDSDFDFEKAQLDFKILEEKFAGVKINGATVDGDQVDEEQKDEESPKKSAYSKSSFFDTISCEALERQKGAVQRPDWKNERKLNRETFGLINQPRNNFYNRGNSRYGGGGGGGGGFRSNYRRGGSGGYQNRSGGSGGTGRIMNRNSSGGGGGQPQQQSQAQPQQQQQQQPQQPQQQQQQHQQPTSTTNGTAGNKAPVKTNNGVSSTSSAATSAAILAAVTGSSVVLPAKN